MNIKKEIKLFEKHAQKFFTTNDAFAKEGDNYIYDEVKFMWDCWLTAKQQAVPSGYCIVPVEPTKDMITSGSEYYSESCSLSGLYKAMIQEAQK